MNDLRDLLEVLYRSHERTKTLVAEYRDWSHPKPSYELVVDRSALGAVAQARWKAPLGPWPEEAVLTRRIWYENPDRLRIEVLRNQRVVRLGVRNGAGWWRWNQADGAAAGKLSPDDGVVTIPRLLDPVLLAPTRLLERLYFEPTGEAVRAGRTVVCATARLRRQLGSQDGVRYELEFDAQHGTLLRRAVFEDDAPVQITEALEIGYGLDIGPDRFTFVSPGSASTNEPGDSPAGGARPPSVHISSQPVASAPPLQVNGRQGRGNSAGSYGTMWLTGLPAAGKTTLAHAVKAALDRHGVAAHVLDGDVLRRGLSSDLGFSRADRAEQTRRAAHVAALLGQLGITAIVALISPCAEDRQDARRVHHNLGLPFWEIWVDTPLAVCERRDPKGLYARARAGRLIGLTGVDAPYESPSAPDLHVSGYSEHPDEVAAQLTELLLGSPQLEHATAGIP